MSYTIKNKFISAGINAKGAELFRVTNHEHNIDYMWSGDPVFWGKTSPVLFPIVGTLKDNTYIFGEKNYTLSRHGFARDMVFTVADQHEDSITFLLTNTEKTLSNFPFPFELRIIYAVIDNALHVTYEVKNTGSDTMYFSLGAHPAFKVPLIDGTRYEDHYLEFNKTETAPRWPITSEGLINHTPEPLLQNTTKLPLSKKLFEKDALVLKNLQSNKVSLKSTTHEHGLDFFFDGFPFLGIWAAKHADFVCIEPWCGIADSVDHQQQFITKEGIENVLPDKVWTRTWHVNFF